MRDKKLIIEYSNKTYCHTFNLTNSQEERVLDMIKVIRIGCAVGELIPVGKTKATININKQFSVSLPNEYQIANLELYINIYQMTLNVLRKY